MVLGAFGPELLFRLATEEQVIRMAIDNEHESLCFRENLRVLSHAPGLMLHVIARLNLREPTTAFPLAVAEFKQAAREENESYMDLPESLCGRVMLGFDELKQKHLRNALASVAVLGEQQVPFVDDPLASLRRRWIATMLSGQTSQLASKHNTVATEIAMLNRHGFSTGAGLLDALARSHSATDSIGDVFLATALYLRTCRLEFAKARAILTWSDQT